MRKIGNIATKSVIIFCVVSGYLKSRIGHYAKTTQNMTPSMVISEIYKYIFKLLYINILCI